MTVSVLIGDCIETMRGLPAGRFIKGQHAYRKPQPHWERDWLVAEYVAKCRSTGDIAREIGCTDGNVLFWLRKHGIPRRNVSQARALKHWGVSGEANPMHGKTGAANPRFVDGSSPERQRLYVQSEGRRFLQAVYQRDGFCCVRCAAPKVGARSIHAHHIAPWAGNPGLRFDLGNAVTLCRPCHHWVHSKRNTAREYLR